MARPTLDLILLLQVLLDHQVEFIVVGGVCAALHGAPVTTFDLDIVHGRDASNLNRLIAALNALDAYYREPTDRKLRPQREHLASSGHHLFTTRAGPLDLRGTIGTDQGFEDLVEHTSEVRVGTGLVVKILNLDTLIEIKERLGRDKDKAALPFLRSTLEERDKLNS